MSDEDSDADSVDDDEFDAFLGTLNVLSTLNVLKLRIENREDPDQTASS